jgi:hypothetical protein
VDDDYELALVKKAFALAGSARPFVTGYVEWKATSADNCRNRAADLDGLTPEELRELAIEFVVNGGELRQKREDRREHLDYEYTYRIVMPCPGLPTGIFVEFALHDDDPVDPAVLIVSAHRQGV